MAGTVHFRPNGLLPCSEMIENVYYIDLKGGHDVEAVLSLGRHYSYYRFSVGGFCRVHMDEGANEKWHPCYAETS